MAPGCVAAPNRPDRFYRVEVSSRLCPKASFNFAKGALVDCDLAQAALKKIQI
jgi:hypothetical protein